MSGTPASIATRTPSLNPTRAPIAWTPSDGVSVRQVMAAPNPQAGPAYSLSVQLDGNTDCIRVKVYNQAFLLIGNYQVQGQWISGWVSLSISMPGLPNGLYYLMVSLCNASGGHGKIAKLLVAK
jgi:hypothetical protein